MNDNWFVESDRSEFPCACPCRRRWLVSRGQLKHGGETWPFVVMPTNHGDDRMAWLAIGVGSSWACLGTQLQADNIAARVFEPAQSPMRALLDPSTLLSRDHVMADTVLRPKLFAVHDELMRLHQDLRDLFIPDRGGRDFTFAMPDCVHALPREQRSPRNQQNFAECGNRLFARALLPIRISDGGELRVGLWMELDETAFFSLMKDFNDDAAYMKQRIVAPVESHMIVTGHDTRGATVTLAPRTADQCLFIVDAEPAWLQRLLTDGISIVNLPETIAELRASVNRTATA